MLKRLPIRSGNWNNGATAGLFALNLNNDRSNANNNIGARPALVDRQKRQAYWACRQHTTQKDTLSSARAKTRSRKIKQAGRSGSTCVRTFGPAAPRGNFLIDYVAKTYNNLFAQIYSFEALHAAYLRASKGKREKGGVQEFEFDLEGNLIALQNELIWGTYRVGKYHQFDVYEPQKRPIAALPFRDRVVQHAIVAVLDPLWERGFIADSYACRKNRGTHRGADRAQAMLRQVKREHGNVVVFKADIKKYFASITHATLKTLFRKRIACKKTLALLDHIIDSANTLDGCVYGRGVPLGNLTSRLGANLYLHELDLFVKHALREPNYVRYMDDFVIIHHDKAHLQRVRILVEDFLDQHLRLKTNQKTQIFPLGLVRGRALDFLGYRIWCTHRRLRKSSIKRIYHTLRRLRGQYADGKVSLERIGQSVQSWVAHAAHANAKALRESVLKKFVFIRSNK